MMISLVLIACTCLAHTHGLRVVCYILYFDTYKGKLQNKTEDLVPNVCTHLIYFFDLNFDVEIPLTDIEDDKDWDEEMYREYVRIIKLNPHLKILLCLRRLFQDTEMLIKVANTEQSRKTFAINLKRKVRSINFHGAQLDWGNLVAEYNPLYNKDKFLLLLKEIRAEFERDAARTGNKRLILAVTLPGNKRQINVGYNIPEIVKLSDFVSIQAFDFHTALDGKVGLSAAFLPDPNSKGDERTLNFNWVVRYYTSIGLPKDKINMGISFFGRSFYLRDARKSRIGDASEAHRSLMRDRYEMCQCIRTGGTVVDVPAQGGRYHVTGTQWTSYEDNLSVAHKACLIKNEGFGGVTFWSLDTDDVNGTGCGEGRFPLMNTVMHVMTNKDTPICSLKYNTTAYVKALSLNKNRVSRDFPSVQNRVVCYIQSWAYYRRGQGKFSPENIDPNICTHIVYVYAIFRGINIVPFMGVDESEPLWPGLYDRLMNMRVGNPDLKILIGVGGGEGSEYVASLPTDYWTLRTFANNVVEFLKRWDFDGIELTWQVPREGLVPYFMGFFKALREATNSSTVRLILTVSVPAGRSKIDEYGNRIRDIAYMADFISIMTYDFHGIWDPYTGHNSPLYASSNEDELNVDWVSKYLVSLRLPTRKITLGIPTYGRSFILKNPFANTIHAPVSGGGPPGWFTGKAGVLSYYELCHDFHFSPWQRFYDYRLGVPYAFKEKLWVSYDNIHSVTEKACYILCNNFGGANIWSLDMDDFTGNFCWEGKYPLVSTVSKILRSNDTNVRCWLWSAPGAAGKRGLPGHYLKYMNLVLVLLLTVYSAFK